MTCSLFLTMDLRLQHPFNAVVAGPTQCGKSTFVKNLLIHCEQVITPSIERVIWCYGEYQDSLKQLPSKVELLDNLDVSNLTPGPTTLIIIDDMMCEVGKSQTVTQLFTRGTHHRNMSVILILQNMFYKDKEIRTISLNTHYFFIFKNPRDASQITNLAKQMAPGNSKYVQSAYHQATSGPHGYLMFDFKQQTPEYLRLRTGILPDEEAAVFIAK